MRPVDFAHSRRSPVAGRWLMLVGAIALAGAFAWREQEVALHAAMAAERQAQSHRLRNAQVRRQLPPQSRQQVETLRNAQRLLLQPWPQVLRVAEGASQEPVFLTSLQLNVADGTMRLEAEANRFEEVLDYLKALAEPNLMPAGQLVGHEISQRPSGQIVVRFSVTTRWRAP